MHYVKHDRLPLPSSPYQRSVFHLGRSISHALWLTLSEGSEMPCWALPSMTPPHGKELREAPRQQLGSNWILPATWMSSEVNPLPSPDLEITAIPIVRPQLHERTWVIGPHKTVPGFLTYRNWDKKCLFV